MGKEIVNSLDVQAGDLLVGLKEDGFRSVGLAAAQDSFELAFGENWHDEFIEISGRLHKLGDLALRPPTVYTEAITDMNTGYDAINVPKVQIKEAVAITDGGIPGSLSGNLKRSGLGAEVVDPFEPPAIAMLAQAFHPDNISDEEAYRTWCFGQGMIIVTPESGAENAVKVASEHGISAKVIGYVTQQSGIRISSAGVHSAGKVLSYPAS